MSGHTLAERMIHIELQDGRRIEVPLEWLRAQLALQGLHVVDDIAQLVLSAVDGASVSELLDASHQHDWRAGVSGPALLRLKVREQAAFYARADAHKARACEPGPKPTPPPKAGPEPTPPKTR
jgi:hypothetical protein